MKKTTLTYLLIIMTTVLFGQEFKISVAPTISNLSYYKFVPGGLYARAKFGLSTNIDYLFATNKKIEFGIGVGLQNSHVQIIIPNLVDRSTMMGVEKVDLFSISFTSIYNLRQDFYVSLIPTLDFQIKHNSLQHIGNQSGLGLSFGIGNNIKLTEALLLNIEPRLWIHNMIPFQDKNLQYWLTTAGLNMGLVFGHKTNQLPE